MNAEKNHSSGAGSGKAHAPIKLTINRKKTATAPHPAVEVREDFSQQRTEVSLPAISAENVGVPPPADAPEGNVSIADLINANVAGTPHLPTADDDDQDWDNDDVFGEDSDNDDPGATVSMGYKMECIECGAVYESETPLESCACPECNGAMYPLDLFNSEDTLSFFNPLAGDRVADDGSGMSDSKRVIKVAQPVSVGMFSASGSGAVSGGSETSASSSSTSIRTVDFLSSTGSSSSVKLEKTVSIDVEALEREKKDIAEERRKLQQEQESFAAAVASFETRSKALEDMRISLELERETQTAEKVSQTATLFLAQEEELHRKHRKSFVVVLVLSFLLVLESAALIILFLMRK